MNPDQHPKQEVLDLLALGAAGALSDDEYRELDELLAGDPDLAREYDDLVASAAALAEASSEAPPPHLRASILDAIRGVDQLPRHEPATAVHDEPGAAVAPVVQHEDRSNVVPIRHRRWMVPATAAAAALLLLGGGLLVRRVADAPADRMAEVLDDDQAITIPLDGSLTGLRVVASDREDAAVLVGRGLDAPESGRVFQLWALIDEQMIGMGTFTPDSTGAVEMVMEGGDGVNDWAVTIEPEGGSDQPTADPVAVSPGLA